jgi:hypothetical protein
MTVMAVFLFADTLQLATALFILILSTIFMKKYSHVLNPKSNSRGYNPNNGIKDLYI